MHNGIAQYQRVTNESGVLSASPHQLIQMLFDGADARLAAARGHIQRHEYEGKAKALGKAISIVGGLQSSLDTDKGGDVAAKLLSLYDYINRRILEANRDNDVAAVDEVMDLLRTIGSGWRDMGRDSGQ